jgi:hypothetical protein
MQIPIFSSRLGLWLIVTSILFQHGCATVPQFRSDTNMEDSNPIEKVAILVSGRVVWPRMGGNEPGTDMQASKGVLIKLANEARSRFETKGYQVSLSEATGVGYKNSFFKNNVVYEDYENFGDEKQYTAPDKSPIYVFPEMENKPELAAATKQLFETLESNITNRTLNTMEYPLDHVVTIGALTSSDAVCLVRGYGIKFSTARAAGALALALLGSYVDTSDKLDILVSCADTKNGKILYQRGFFIVKNPNEIESADIDKAMLYFPSANETIPETCKALDDNKHLYTCNGSGSIDTQTAYD